MITLSKYEKLFSIGFFILVMSVNILILTVQHKNLKSYVINSCNTSHCI